MEYQLQKDLDFIAFLKKIRQCRDEVWLLTDEEDVLNLKSALSQYVAVVLAERPEMLSGSRIRCGAEDAEVLREFLSMPIGGGEV
ncbi:MAG: polya polymerase [Eubacteriales bacterium]|nr:polya polymerase [Eubacteriales bacterium]